MVKLCCKFRLFWAATLMAAAACAFAAGPPRVPVTHDLQADGQRSEQRSLPIMLVFTAPGCSYCKLLKRDFLKPMLRSGDYANKVLIREVKIEAGQSVVDFAGKSVSTSALAQRYHVRVTPTVLFLDGQGRELAKPMVGINSVDFYGSYLDQSIDVARSKLQAGHSAADAARSTAHSG